MTQMKKSGDTIPPIPCAFIEADTYHDAKKLVLLAISQYGKLDNEGFLDFIADEDFDLEDFDFPDFEIPSLDLDEKQTEITGAKELGENDFDNFQHQCPKCSFEWDDKK
jgi:hypothetical protein